MTGTTDSKTLANLQHVVKGAQQRHFPQAQVLGKPGVDVEHMGGAKIAENLAVTGTSSVTGAATCASSLAVTGAATCASTLAVTGGVTDLSLGGDIFAKASASVTLPVTATSNTDGTITQPANTVIKDIIVIPQSAITTAGNSGDDLDFSMGTAAGGTQLLIAKAILDDGGAAVTAAAYVPLHVVSNYTASGANAFKLIGGPATNEAFTITDTAGILHSTAARTLHFRFTPLANDLSATGDIKVVVNFRKASV